MAAVDGVEIDGRTRDDGSRQRNEFAKRVVSDLGDDEPVGGRRSDTAETRFEGRVEEPNSGSQPGRRSSTVSP